MKSMLISHLTEPRKIAVNRVLEKVHLGENKIKEILFFYVEVNFVFQVCLSGFITK